MCCAVKFLILLLGFSACQADELRVYQGSPDKYVTTPVHDPTVILSHLNKSRDTCFYAFGINSDPTDESVITVVTALINTFNVVVLDWSLEAKNLLGIAPISYVAYNIPGAETVGYRFGTALVTLIENGLSQSSFFLMGHSLGAQIVGVAGRRTKSLGYLLSKIIGLDPAGPGFTTVVPLLPTLDTGCANVTIILHTDPGQLGSDEATGHIDFWPNYNKTFTIQPGCPPRSNSIVYNSACSHNYAWRLMSASVKFPTLLEGAHATDGDTWLAGQGDPNDVAYISTDATPGASGSYFLKTGADYPYGYGEDGIYP